MARSSPTRADLADEGRLRVCVGAVSTAVYLLWNLRLGGIVMLLAEPQIIAGVGWDAMQAQLGVICPVIGFSLSEDAILRQPRFGVRAREWGDSSSKRQRMRA